MTAPTQDCDWRAGECHCGAYPSPRHVRLPNGTTWPHPSDIGDVEWRLRYGTPDRSDLLVAASYIAAYRQLVWSTQKQRNESARLLRAAVRGPGACGDPACPVLHSDPANPIHPPDYIDSRSLTGGSTETADREPTDPAHSRPSGGTP